MADKRMEDVLSMAEGMEELKHKKKSLAKGQHKKRADHKHEYVLVPYVFTDSRLPATNYAKVCKRCGYINTIYFKSFCEIETLAKKIPLIRGTIYYGKIGEKYLPGFKKGMFDKMINVSEV